MVARVYDKSTDTYFKSEVYAIINAGWYERRLVLVPADTGSYFKLFDYLDKGDPQNPIPAINLITPKVLGDPNWICQGSGSTEKHLENFTELLGDDVLFFSYNGYSWIFENKSMLAGLLKGDIVPLKGSGLEDKILDYRLKDFNYIETQEDIDFLMEQTHSFHDAILYEINYLSGAYINEVKIINPEDGTREVTMNSTDDLRRVTMIFQSPWCRSVEMIFEGVTALNLRPSTDNYSAEISAASLSMHNATVFFCTSDSEIDKIDLTNEGTWIKAYSLRWRFLEQQANPTPPVHHNNPKQAGQSQITQGDYI